MKRLFKYLLVALGILVLCSPLLYFVAVNVAMKAHFRNEKIILESKVVEEGISDYVNEHGKPPARLADLVPEYVASLPVLSDISRVDYQVSGSGKEWTLDLYWTNRKIPLIFRRTNAVLSPEDVRRQIDIENGCHLLKVGGAP